MDRDALAQKLGFKDYASADAAGKAAIDAVIGAPSAGAGGSVGATIAPADTSGMSALDRHLSGVDSTPAPQGSSGAPASGGHYSASQIQGFGYAPIHPKDGSAPYYNVSGTYYSYDPLSDSYMPSGKTDPVGAAIAAGTKPSAPPSGGGSTGGGATSTTTAAAPATSGYTQQQIAQYGSISRPADGSAPVGFVNNVAYSQHTDGTWHPNKAGNDPLGDALKANLPPLNPNATGEPVAPTVKAPPAGYTDAQLKGLGSVLVTPKSGSGAFYSVGGVNYYRDPVDKLYHPSGVDTAAKYLNPTGAATTTTTASGTAGATPGFSVTSPTVGSGSSSANGPAPTAPADVPWLNGSLAQRERDAAENGWSPSAPVSFRIGSPAEDAAIGNPYSLSNPHELDRLAGLEVKPGENVGGAYGMVTSGLGIPPFAGGNTNNQPATGALVNNQVIPYRRGGQFQVMPRHFASGGHIEADPHSPETFPYWVPDAAHPAIPNDAGPTAWGSQTWGPYIAGAPMHVQLGDGGQDAMPVNDAFKNWLESQSEPGLEMSEHRYAGGGRMVVREPEVMIPARQLIAGQDVKATFGEDRPEEAFSHGGKVSIVNHVAGQPRYAAGSQNQRIGAALLGAGNEGPPPAIGPSGAPIFQYLGGGKLRVIHHYDVGGDFNYGGAGASNGDVGGVGGTSGDQTSAVIGTGASTADATAGASTGTATGTAGGTPGLQVTPPAPAAAPVTPPPTAQQQDLTKVNALPPPPTPPAAGTENQNSGQVDPTYVPSTTSFDRNGLRREATPRYLTNTQAYEAAYSDWLKSLDSLQGGITDQQQAALDKLNNTTQAERDAISGTQHLRDVYGYQYGAAGLPKPTEEAPALGTSGMGQTSGQPGVRIALLTPEAQYDRMNQSLGSAASILANRIATLKSQASIDRAAYLARYAVGGGSGGGYSSGGSGGGGSSAPATTLANGVPLIGSVLGRGLAGG